MTSTGDANAATRTDTSASDAPSRAIGDLFGLLIWLVALAVIVLALQGLSDLLGLGFDLSQEGGAGRAIVLILAAGGVFIVKERRGRSAAEYGITIDDRWLRIGIIGFACGAGVYAAYWIVAFTLGAATFQPPKPHTWLTAALTAMLALLISPLQEIIYRGYVLAVCRRALGVAIGITISALFFALTIRFDPFMLAQGSRAIFITIALLGALLALARLAHRSIMMPIGLTAGWLFVEIMLRRTRIVAGVDDPALAAWLCPNADARAAPALWIIFALACLGYIAFLTRKGVAPEASAPAKTSQSFKRFFPFSNLSMLAPLDVWVGRLVQARFRIPPFYWPRLLASLVFSAINTLLTLPERVLWPILLRNQKVTDPVFILGVHRSGTTHLHNLLALDPQFVSPRTYQVMNPIGFVISGWIIMPLLALFAPGRRPMDAVKFSFFTTGEEEFAIQHQSKLSPYWSMTFPQEGEHYDRYVFGRDFSDAEKRKWKQLMLRFLRRLCLFTSRTPLLKNPYNTARVALLRELFPGARFVHIHRHPFAVQRSNAHMEREGHCIWQLQDTPDEGGYADRFLNRYAAVEQAYHDESADLPDHQRAEVSYEQLDDNPLAVIEQLYVRLDLELSDTFRARLDRYLDSLAGYKKNKHRPLPDDERQRLQSKLQPLLERWNYDPTP